MHTILIKNFIVYIRAEINTKTKDRIVENEMKNQERKLKKQ